MLCDFRFWDRFARKNLCPRDLHCHLTRTQRWAGMATTPSVEGVKARAQAGEFHFNSSKDRMQDYGARRDCYMYASLRRVFWFSMHFLSPMYHMKNRVSSIYSSVFRRSHNFGSAVGTARNKPPPILVLVTNKYCNGITGRRYAHFYPLTQRYSAKQGYTLAESVKCDA